MLKNKVNCSTKNAECKYLASVFGVSHFTIAVLPCKYLRKSYNIKLFEKCGKLG